MFATKIDQFVKWVISWQGKNRLELQSWKNTFEVTYMCAYYSKIGRTKKEGLRFEEWYGNS